MDTTVNKEPYTTINHIPDDVLVLVLFFLPSLAEIARTSILCRRWRNIWHNVPRLDFDATVLLPRDIGSDSRDWYVQWVNKVTETRTVLLGFPPVKEFLIKYKIDATQSCHIRRWINFAIANRVETLHLEFSPYFGVLPKGTEYELSEDIWFKASSGPSSLKCLKSLFLGNVNVTKRFIEFILSSCPLLEDLSLYRARSYEHLDISGELPLRLRLLNIDSYTNFAVHNLCAPHLTTLFYKSGAFEPQKIDVPMLNNLAVGPFGVIAHSQPIMKYLEHFWSYLPQLERLHLIMEGFIEEFRLNPMPEFIKLKYLKISFGRNTDPFICQIINIIKACPSLETFAYQTVLGELNPSIYHRSQIWYEREEVSCCFKCLKVLELYGPNGKLIDQEIVKILIDNSPHLEKLIVDTRMPSQYAHLHGPDLDIVELVTAKAKKLCQGRLLEIEITVIG